MYIRLEENKELIKKHNERIREIKTEHEDDEIIQDMKEIDGLDDVICLYSEFIEASKKIKENDIYLKVPDKRKIEDNIYVTFLNGDFYIDMLTDYKIDKAKSYRLPYGVADNAEQILDYLKTRTDVLNETDEYVVLMTPIYKDLQPERDGWRWHKWGEYIGVQNSQCEYLYDEKDIEMVFVFEVVEVAKKAS